MITFLRKYWFIIAILALAAFLRLYQLGSYPALNADEAAIGYNAYSLIQTGRDEHGHPWPIHFQSFNDYKPGLYFYMVLPFVKFIGLTEWAVRLPNAMLGVGTVLALYLLVRELNLGVSNPLRGRNFRLEIEDVAALFLAISPWHLHFSRGGWEVNVATFFITLGVLMFLKALRRPQLFVFSFIFFALSLYTYHAARVIVPFLGVGLFVIYRKEIITNSKYFLISVALGAVLLLPLGRDLVRGDVLSRAAGVGLFADKGPINRINEQRGEHNDAAGLYAKMVHNKVANFGLAFLENWADHFHGEFLFLTGDTIQRNKVPETGEMYLFDIIFLAFGLVVIFRNLNKESKLILYWLGIAPIAAALTFQAPHALRAQPMVIPLVVISSLGFVTILRWISGLTSRKFSFALYLLVFSLVVWNFMRYTEMYYSHMSKEYPFSSQYGVKELITFISGQEDRYKNIIITDRYDQPYILFLFYTKYPPQDFQNNHALTTRDGFGFSTVREIGALRFESIDFQSMKELYPDSLIVGTPNEIPKEANVIKRIYGTNGFEYFDIVAN